jgi:pimeloyl-ACP methyl ester carboxylesterase
MNNLRKYGKPPFGVAVIHGGPGAGGEMAPVARELASDCGVLEPIQTATSLKGQLEELKTVLEKNTDLPVILIGFSWGAWLSFIFAAKNHEFVKKLILIGSGPYEEKYAGKILETRLKRLGKMERTEAESLMGDFKNPTHKKRKSDFIRFGELFSKADTYALTTGGCEPIDFNADIFHSVWKDGAKLRKSGSLLEIGKDIRCPVVAIHGDYDPHPAEGVQKPLNAFLQNFRFIMLKHCGHKPWVEREAKEQFFRILKKESELAG